VCVYLPPGAANAQTVLNSDDVFKQAFARIAGLLNLRSHNAHGVTIDGPFDCEGHKSQQDGLYYMLDFARLFPCEALSSGQ